MSLFKKLSETFKLDKWLEGFKKLEGDKTWVICSQILSENATVETLSFFGLKIFE